MTDSVHSLEAMATDDALVVLLTSVQSMLNMRPGRVLRKGGRLRKYATQIARYFRNQGSVPFIADPFARLNNDKSSSSQHHRKVGSHELLYDLFLVAALSTYTGEADLSKGGQIGSFILFFATLWAIWASQSLHDVRYGTKDGLVWLVGYAQLCVFGAYAAISGDFDVSRGFDANASDVTSVTDWQTPHYVLHQQQTSSSPQAILRSFFTASIVFATSRIVLLGQYAIVLYYARKHKLSLSPILSTVAALLLSTVVWFVAAGLTFQEGRGWGIARLTLWSSGLALEFGSCFYTISSQHALAVDLAYFGERLSALTLIVLGEGIIGGFGTFRKVLAGLKVQFSPTHASTTAGLIFCAVGLYCLLYQLYFGRVSHKLRDRPWVQGAWCSIHFPLHLSLLLLTQCIIRALEAMNVDLTLDALVEGFDNVSNAVDQLSGAQQSNLTAMAEVLLVSPSAQQMQIITTGFQLDWLARVKNSLTLCNGNTAVLQNIIEGEFFSALAAMFTAYGFAPDEKTYELIEAAFATASQHQDIADIISQYAAELIRPVYVSVMYGLTVLGGYLVCLAGLLVLQRKSKSKASQSERNTWSTPEMWTRLIIGTILLLLTLLDIGSFYSPSQLSDLEDPDHGGFVTGVAPIYAVAGSIWLLPIIFLAALSVLLVDFIAFLHRHARDDDGSKDIETPTPKGSQEVAEIVDILSPTSSTGYMLAFRGQESPVIEEGKSVSIA